MLGAVVDEMFVRLIDHQPRPLCMTKGGDLLEEGLGADGTGGVSGGGKDNDLDRA